MRTKHVVQTTGLHNHLVHICIKFTNIMTVYVGQEDSHLSSNRDNPNLLIGGPL